MPDTDRDPQTGLFIKGKNGGPGRPKGSRNKLGEAFLADMLEDWQDNGKAAIAVVRAEKPDAYLKVVASILPKELNVRVNEFDDLTDEQLARQLAAVSARLVGMEREGGEGVGAAAGSQSVN